MYGARFWILDAGCWLLGSEFWVQGLGVRVELNR